jgi:hypothetical protein
MPAIAADRRLRQKLAVSTGVRVLTSLDLLGFGHVSYGFAL